MTARALGSTSYRSKTTRTARCTAASGSISKPRSPHWYLVAAGIFRGGQLQPGLATPDRGSARRSLEKGGLQREPAVATV
jgi:hypothetical protein